MNQQTTELLNTLAIKFGTTVEHLWAVLVKQAMISAAFNLGFTILAIVGLVFWLLLILSKFKVPLKTEENPHPESSWDADAKEFTYTITAVVTLALFITLSFAIYDTATAIHNPEYWALKQIIDFK